MNRSIIIYMLGWIMNIEAFLLFLPIITAAVYRESVITFYLVVSCICGVLGFLCTRKKPKVKMFFAKEGFVLVSLGWIVLSFLAVCPFGSAAKFLILLMRCLKLFPVLQLPEPVLCQR